MFPCWKKCQHCFQAFWSQICEKDHFWIFVPGGGRKCRFFSDPDPPRKLSPVPVPTDVSPTSALADLSWSVSGGGVAGEGVGHSRTGCYSWSFSPILGSTYPRWYPIPLNVSLWPALLYALHEVRFVPRPVASTYLSRLVTRTASCFTACQLGRRQQKNQQYLTKLSLKKIDNIEILGVNLGEYTYAQGADQGDFFTMWRMVGDRGQWTYTSRITHSPAEAGQERVGRQVPCQPPLCIGAGPGRGDTNVGAGFPTDLDKFFIHLVQNNNTHWW